MDKTIDDGDSNAEEYDSAKFDKPALESVILVWTPKIIHYVGLAMHHGYISMLVAVAI